MVCCDTVQGGFKHLAAFGVQRLFGILEVAVLVKGFTSTDLALEAGRSSYRGRQWRQGEAGRKQKRENYSNGLCCPHVKFLVTSLTVQDRGSDGHMSRLARSRLPCCTLSVPLPWSGPSTAREHEGF